MNNNRSTTTSAIASSEDSLKILREVSNVYESMKEIRKQAARLAKDGNHSYQALADAMGTTRSAAHQLLNRDAAA